MNNNRCLVCRDIIPEGREVCHYIVLKRWQNTDNKFSKRGFLDGGNNTIIAWCETPELPKNIPLAEVIEKIYELQKNEILKIADILLETSRQDSNDKSKNKAYTAFDVDNVFKYGCDRLNGATALYDGGYCKINDIINYLEAFNALGHNTYAIKLIKNRFMNSEDKNG